MKIGILGAGWIGLPFALSMAGDHSIWATTSDSGKALELRAAGVEPLSFRLFDEAGGLPEDFVDVLLITLPPSAFRGEPERAFGEITRWANEHASKAIYLSSTSVYPNTSGAYDEEDAEMIISRHSGIAMLSLEQSLSRDIEIPLCILRLGGLAGYDRKPWQSSRAAETWPQNEESINYVHRDDIVRAIRTVCIHFKSGVFNVVCPEPTSKGQVWDLLSASRATNATSESSRVILSESFRECFDFSFLYNSILTFPELGK